MFDKIKKTLVSAGKTAAVWAKENKPEILLVGGIILVVGGAVAACVATANHVDDILDDAKEELETIREKDDGKGTLKVYTKTIGKMVRAYAFSMVGISVGVGLIVHSHVELRKENARLAEELLTVTTSFLQYRQNVMDRFGKEVDHQLLHGQKVITDEAGNEVLVDGEENRADRFIYRITPDFKALWDHNPDIFLGEIKALEHDVNDKMNNERYLTVAEIIKKFDLKHKPTKAEMRYGWKRTSPDRIRKIAFEMPVKGDADYVRFCSGEIDYFEIRLIPEMDIYNGIQNPEYFVPEDYQTFGYNPIDNAYEVLA